MPSQCFCPDGPTLFHNGAAGDSTCMECGVVLSEGALVSEVSFGETSGGAAMAHGTLVAEGSTHARTGGGRRGGEESSEQAIYNGRIRIAQIATAMNIPDTLRESALRFYKLAIAQRFTKGRRSRLVVAACLYAACQHVQFGFMLIDFSDLLQAEEVTAEVEEQEQQQRGARKKRAPVEDKLDDLDEEELDAFLLTDEEVKLKTRVWVELNREYLEKLAAKGLDEEEGVTSKKKPLKPAKPKQPPRDSMSARGATPAEAVGHLLKKPKFSRKINYSAVETLFKSPAAISKIGKAPMSSWDDASLQVDEEDADREIVHHLTSFGDDTGAESYGVHGIGGGEEDGIGEDEYYDDGGYQEEV
ncbi:transcription factor TFIIIB subunit brf1 [Tulasnella sp. JGI-2019a]|nr:transcription factor TFIIIB subunit brf1 [Tulasnella sp. JGI-2019a]